MKIHADVLAAHAQFGGDLETMQRCYEWYDLKSEIESLRSRAEKAEAELLTMTKKFNGAVGLKEQQRMRAEYAEDHAQRLQAALAFWMPGVSEAVEIETNGRAGDDAQLLAGFNGTVPTISWGDKVQATCEKLAKALELAKDHSELEDEVLDIVDEALSYRKEASE
jgi:predicted RNA-binding protein with TRAM domain